MNLNSIYRALVPAWLANALERRGLDLVTATDFEKLENTLSTDDVCFYVSYLQNAQRYIGDLFNDMQCVSTTEANAKWIYKNQNRLANVKSQTAGFYANSNELVGNQVPLVVRKTNYVAQALPEQSCLAIVGRDTSEPLNSAQLADQSVSELAKLASNETISKLAVFKAFTQTAA